MASWKKKGVVPDSDDDEDLEFQLSTEDGLAGDTQGFQLYEEAEQSLEHNSLHNEKQELPGDPIQRVSQISYRPGLSPHQPENDQLYMSESPRVFKVPLTLSDIDCGTDPKRIGLGTNSNMGEDISQSYVTLSSRSSSLTSLASSLEEELQTGDIHGVENGNQNLHFQSSPGGPWNVKIQELPDSIFEFSLTNRRSLRQRNPIQLHPYALEGEKYRRTLMARGMRPIRLTQVQQAARKNHSEDYSPDPETEVENESQSLSFEDQLQLSQISSDAPIMENGAKAQPSSYTHVSIHAPEEDDEDLPDIGQLLSRQGVGFERRGVKRQKVTYTSRYAPGRLPISTINQLPRPRNLLNNLDGVNDALASPPATSSPTPLHRLLVNDIKVSEMSKLPADRANSLECTDSDEIAHIGNLPTPATESTKHTVDLTADDIYEQDCTNSDSESHSSSSNASQHLHIRRVGKRIRGVLPASWLRLDQQTKKIEDLNATRHETPGLSLLKAPIRRGTAMRRDVATESSPLVKLKHPMDDKFLFDDDDSDDDDEDDDDDEGHQQLNFFAEPMLAIEEEISPSRIETDYAIEDDRIDIMAPSQKKQSKLLPRLGNRKRTQSSTSLFRSKSKEVGHQPKITEHLSRARRSYSNNSKLRGQNISSNSSISRKVRSKTTIPLFKKVLPPKLSILDVMDKSSDNRERLPQFIRIAARNVRSKKNLGRQSPTRKFIKLANRNDTSDAQSVLREWREGTIQPRDNYTPKEPAQQFRIARVEITDQMLSEVLPWTDHAAPDMTEVPGKIRKLAILKPRQSKTGEMAELDSSRKVQEILPKTQLGPSTRRRIYRMTAATVRPAQLETTLSEYSQSHPSHAFVSTKKTLDNLYKKTHRGSEPRGDVQLARFLTKDPIAKPKDAAPSTDTSKTEEDIHVQFSAPIKQNRKKRKPRRIDAGAALFRQPSEPLVLELLQENSESRNMTRDNGKVVGLGSYGTIYTYHFDIFPIPQGVFFHESTFVGSGRLCKALELPSDRHFGVDRGHIFHQLAEKQLRWGPWNDNVSSELGLCFDWIAEQLEMHAGKRLTVESSPMLECLTFVIDFVQSYLSFANQPDCSECLLRFSDVLEALIVRLESLSTSFFVEDACDPKPFVELTSRGMVLMFQVLRISQLDTLELNFTNRFEVLLQRASSILVRQLLRIGLAPVRSLYDNLQYLAVREAGIKEDEYVAQAWLIAMHILHSAQIPRVSFWDIFNLELMNDRECQLNDARVVERMWYSMISLLPLVEFDKIGVVISGSRMSTPFENWELPQRITKKIFELYATKSRQSPSFNDYCRALFARCNHLIQNWGWSRQVSIIGTLFDFFATNKLAHLRNEEVYQSPRFLKELDREPELSVESQDRCFHILLKIIVISVKQMRVVGDVRGIRNLVARVLPNHDRQYPKEEAIHQRDLASLRNHHDLLCTLFWSAPPELRPPLILLRELVNPERSHKEAYLISLRAWENLTRFVLASDSTSEAYLPLGIWQYESFTQLLVQHQAVEKDIEDQFSNFSQSAKQQIPQDVISRTIRGNRNQIIMALVAHLTALETALMGAGSLQAMALVFKSHQFTNTICRTLRIFRRGEPQDMLVVEKALDILIFYVSTVNKAAISLFSAENQASQEDSQGLDALSFEKVDFRTEYFGQLDGSLLAAVRDILRFCIRAVSPVDNTYIDKVIHAWSLMAGTTILCDRFTLADFVSDSGMYAELKMDDRSSKVRTYAGEFLATLVTTTDSRIDFKISERDILSDWLCLLVTPVQLLKQEHMNVLGQQFAACEPMLKCIQDKITFRPTLFFEYVHHVCITMVKTLFHEMYESLHQEPTNVSNKDDEKIRYQAILGRIMTILKMDLSDMAPDSPWTKIHWKLADEVIDNITTFFRDLCPIDVFFKTSSTYPWEGSSRMAVITFRRYGLRLDTHRGRSELNHFCLSIFKKAAVEENLHDLHEQLRTAMTVEKGNWRGLTKYMLIVFIPSVTYAAFLSDFGWLPAGLFLQVAEHQINDVANLDPKLALYVAGKIVYLIVNGLKTLYAKCPINAQELKNETIYILLIATRFTNSIMEWLGFLMDQMQEDNKAGIGGLMYNLADFSHFALSAVHYLKKPVHAWTQSLNESRRLNQSQQQEVDYWLKSYEALDANNGAHLSQRKVALRKLGESLFDFATRPQEWTILRSFLRQKYLSGYVIFQGVRDPPIARIHPNSDFGEFEGFHPQSLPLTDAPEFSAVILEDIRNHWRRHPNGVDIKIRSGSDEKIARDREGLLSDKMALYQALEKALENFLWNFDNLNSSPGKWVSRQRHCIRNDLSTVP